MKNSFAKKRFVKSRAVQNRVYSLLLCLTFLMTLPCPSAFATEMDRSWSELPHEVELSTQWITPDGKVGKPPFQVQGKMKWDDEETLTRPHFQIVINTPGTLRVEVLDEEISHLKTQNHSLTFETGIQKLGIKLKVHSEGKEADPGNLLIGPQVAQGYYFVSSRCNRLGVNLRLLSPEPKTFEIFTADCTSHANSAGVQVRSFTSHSFTSRSSGTVLTENGKKLSVEPTGNDRTTPPPVEFTTRGPNSDQTQNKIVFGQREKNSYRGIYLDLSPSVLNYQESGNNIAQTSVGFLTSALVRYSFFHDSFETEGRAFIMTQPSSLSIWGGSLQANYRLPLPFKTTSFHLSLGFLGNRSITDISYGFRQFSGPFAQLSFRTQERYRPLMVYLKYSPVLNDVSQFQIANVLVSFGASYELGHWYRRSIHAIAQIDRVSVNFTDNLNKFSYTAIALGIQLGMIP